MTKDASKAASSENLVKSSATGSVELAESELDKVAGGRKAGEQPKEYLKVELNDVLISG